MCMSELYFSKNKVIYFRKVIQIKVHVKIYLLLSIMNTLLSMKRLKYNGLFCFFTKNLRVSLSSKYFLNKQLKSI